MQTERKEQWFMLAKLLVLAICAFLYSYGGMEFKWLRRYLAPCVMITWNFIYSRYDWRTLLCLPMMGTLSMGYGAETMFAKIARRGIWGLANGTTSSLYNIARKKWLIFALQATILVEAYIILGVYNPFNSARIEETVLGLFVFALPILSVQRRVKNGS